MNITIDTTNKNITINHTVVIGELISFLKEILPTDWRDYKIISLPSTYNYTYYQPSNPYGLSCSHTEGLK